MLSSGGLCIPSSFTLSLELIPMAYENETSYGYAPCGMLGAFSAAPHDGSFYG